MIQSKFNQLVGGLVDGKTASKWFFRGLKRGDWLWLVVAVMIASSSITFVGLLAKSVKDSMIAQAAESLGADYILQSSRPIELKWVEKAKQLNLATAQSQTLITMASHNDKFQLVQLQAVSDNFPLRGIKPNFLTENSQSNERVFVEPAVSALMNLTQGDNLTLGEKTFKVAGEHQARASGFSGAFAPKIFIRLADLASTQLKGAGSRVTYQLAMIGSQKAIENFANAVTQQASPNLQVISAKAPSQDLARSLDTAWLFLDLSALSAVLVAGLSILIASRFYLQRWQASIALMRSFGAEKKQIFRLFAWQLTWLATIASLLGVLLGSLFFELISPLLAGYFNPVVKPGFGWVHLHGFLMGFLVLWGFAWQAFSHAIKTSPLSILKSAQSSTQMSAWLISFVLIAILVVSITGYVTWVLLGLIVVSVALYLSALLLLWLIGRWQLSSKGWLKISLSALTREAGLVKIQLISVGLVLYVLMLMTFVRQDLMENWQTSLPENTPDTFIMNVQPDQKKIAETILENYQINSNLIAMTRGRFVAVNKEVIEVNNQTNLRAKRLLEREANIGVMDFPVEYNEILKQQKISNSKLPKVSVESSIMETFKLKLGDVLTFSFSGQHVDYQIESVRQVKWQSLRLNFFFIIEPTQTTLPISYLGNFRLNDKEVTSHILTKTLAEQTPGVLLIDAQKILAQVQTIMAQASWAVSGLYIFTLFASLIVLFSATLSSQQTRLQSWLLLRTMGASHREIVKIGVMEFVLLGGFAGLLAAVLSQITSILISHFNLEVVPQVNPVIWISSLVVGISVLVIIGWLTQKQYLHLSPYQMAKKAK
jgi:putative ABC transport system permease protein